jgi:hypothetical protein
MRTRRRPALPRSTSTPAIHRRLTRGALAAALALPLVTFADRPARACGSSVRYVGDRHAPRIAAAEKALREGQHALAVAGVLEMFPDIRERTPNGASRLNRALRVMALAAVRSGGAITAGAAWRGGTAEERSANLAWATATLRALSDLRKDDPAAQTDLAEALAKDKPRRAEARSILEALAHKDLITSPQAYRALAELRGAAGDLAGRDAALKRCEAMATEPGVCRPGAPPAGGGQS